MSIKDTVASELAAFLRKAIRCLMAKFAGKRAVGAVWESRSDGRCRFITPTNNDFKPILKAVKTRK